MTTIDIEDLFVPATSDEWKEQMLENADSLELKTSSWQTGGMARTIIAIMANINAQHDGIASIIAQGGFLDFAASGTVTYTAANGIEVTQKVSPDPSVPGENDEGEPTWLDLLASSRYNVERIGASFATNDLAIANVSSNTYGPFSVGSYHASNPASGSGYSNAELFSIPPSTIVGTTISSASNSTPILVQTSTNHGLSGTETIFINDVLGNTSANGFWKISVLSPNQFTLEGSTGNGAYTSGGKVRVCTVSTFAADVAGPGGTSAVGTITETVTVLSGISIKNLDNFVGNAWEGNVALAARCRLKLQSLSPNGPKGAYEYFALTAASLLADSSLYDPIVQLSSVITRVKGIIDIATGIRTTVVSNASGSVPGISNKAITGATNTTPIEITATGHGLITGDYATINGVLGNTSANGTFQINVTGVDTFTLNNSDGNGIYTSGGILQGGDLGQVDRVIQDNCVPDCITAFTESASPFNITIDATVQVPQAQLPTYLSAAQSALAVWFATLPIGGVDGELDYENIMGVLLASGASSPYKKIVSLVVNGGSVDLIYPSSVSVARLSVIPTITIIGV